MTQTERQQLEVIIQQLDDLREYAPGQAMYNQRELKMRLQVIQDMARHILGESEPESVVNE